MSFNVRTSAMDAQDGDNCWDNRKAVVASIVANQRPAVCGMQVRLRIDAVTCQNHAVIGNGVLCW